MLQDIIHAYIGNTKTRHNHVHVIRPSRSLVCILIIRFIKFLCSWFKWILSELYMTIFVRILSRACLICTTETILHAIRKEIFKCVKYHKIKSFLCFYGNYASLWTVNHLCKSLLFSFGATKRQIVKVWFKEAIDGLFSSTTFTGGYGLVFLRKNFSYLLVL